MQNLKKSNSTSRTYNVTVSHCQPGTLLASAVSEMQTMAGSGTDCWLGRVSKLQKLLNISDRLSFKKGSGRNTTLALKSQFDRYWLDCVQMTKTDNNTNDQTDHNKLRTYRTYKSSFTREPYIDLVRNRNQKSFLVRLRTGSHFLGIEKGRWTRPVTPVDKRICTYCLPPSTSTPSTTSSGPTPPAGPVDDELHFTIRCPRFETERNIIFEEMSSLLPGFLSLSDNEKFVTLLCPTKPQTAKLANRLIKKMFELRDKIDKPDSE